MIINNFNIKPWLLSLIILLIANNLIYTQIVRDLTLKDAIELAQEQSLDAFISKNLYLASYWEFRTYKAERRPWLSFNPDESEYINGITADLSDGIVSYYRTHNLKNYGKLSLSQNVSLTGGEISIYSGLDRIENYLEDGNSVAYNSSPLSISFSQPIFQYNAYRWKKKIEPVKFEKAKKEYIESVENIARQSVNYFFNLLDAIQSRDIALLNKATADTLYRKSVGRYERGALALKDLQRLELNLLNSNLEYEKAQLQLERVKFNLKSFLRLPEDEDIKLIIPENHPTIKIEPKLALEKAIENSPNILDYKQRLLESDQNIARAKGQTGIQSSAGINLGWGTEGSTVESVYEDLKENRSVTFGLYVPIIDWGLSKGYRQRAKFNKEVVTATVEKERIEFEQDVIMSSIEFNMLESQLESVVKAKEIAEKTYKTISDRFLLGKENLETLYAARNERDSALRAYYSKLREIWWYYYYMRSITLYDFENNKSLSQSFDDSFGF